MAEPMAPPEVRGEEQVDATDTDATDTEAWDPSAGAAPIEPVDEALPAGTARSANDDGTAAPSPPINDRAAEPDDRSHETVLVRHGLITHIAILGATAAVDGPAAMHAPDGSASEAFARDAARLAGNVIPLGTGRFGLLLPVPPASPLSDVPHRLLPVCDASHSDVPSPVGPRGDDAPAEGAAGATAALAEPRLRDAEGSGANSGPAPDPGTSLSESEALESRLEARLQSWIDAGMASLTSALSPEGLSAALRDPIGDLISREFTDRIDRLVSEARPGAPTSGAVPPALPGSDPRAEAFWQGMEQALRLLHDTVARMEQSRAAAAEGDAMAETVGQALAALEDTVAVAVEAAGTLWQGTQSGLDDLTAQINALPAPMEAASASFRRIDSRMGTIEAALLAQEARADRMETTLTGIADLLRDPSARSPAAGSITRDELADLLAELQPGTDGTQGDALADLATRLEARGGLLSDEIGKGLRSSKNFWLAAEDALRRLDAALERMEPAPAEPEPPERHPSDASD